MSVTAPPRPPRPSDPVTYEEVEALVEALIEEARQRARRRRRRNGAIVILVALVGVVVFALVGGSAESQNGFPAVSTRVHAAAQAVTSRLAFTSIPRVPQPAPAELYIVNADGSEKRLLARLRGFGGAGVAWSPDGKTIAFASYSRVLLVNADGSGQRNVTRVWRKALPNWSPDGRKIALVRGRSNESADIYVMNPDGSGLRRLTRTPSPAWSAFPLWSPNGRWIAFGRVYPPRERSARRDPTAWKFEVWVMNADGSGQRRVGRGLPSAWLPDGQRLAFTRPRGSEIYVVNADGSGERRLTHNRLNEGQIDLVPEDPQSLRETADRAGVTLSEAKRAFLIQGDDRVGAVADTTAKLAEANVNVTAVAATGAGSGRFGMIVWVAAADYQRAAEALGA